ncbi:hypothetical protein CK203_081700 [Vitis vinifera]|uniref:Mitochondrial protein n=1 Tax=Vitis vinifera TaxID=29760 RepID=A0A438DPU3_VITVI|nr:hypothetical protein CK203_081700 [Vitis vinifera]
MFAGDPLVFSITVIGLLLPDSDIRIPNNIQEALQILEWKTTIEKEIRTLEKNGTWELAELPEGKNPVGSKWIFIVKYKANVSVDRAGC